MNTRTSSKTGRVRRLLSSPVVHFFVLGAALQAFIPEELPVIVVQVSEPAAAEERIDAEILLREAEAAGLFEGRVVSRRLAAVGAFIAGHGEEDDDDAVDRARELGLDHSDVVVRRYAVEMMRLSIAREADRPLPTEEELEAHLRANPERFEAAERLRFHHVFVSARNGEASERVAKELLTQLRAGGAEAGEARGDPFPHGRTMVGSVEEFGQRIGPAFAAGIDSSAVGRWQGPVASAYGLHLVWVEERIPARIPTVAEVRGQLVHHLLRERRALHLRRRLDALRDGYEIRVESAANPTPSSSETQGA
jgi:hypothetical protein